MRPSLREPLLTFVAAIGVASALFWSGKAVPFIHDNLHAFIAVTFFYAPVVAGRVSRRRFDFREAGLRIEPVRTSLAVLALAVVVTLPLFVVGFFAFYDLACAAPTGATGALSRLLAQLCPTPGRPVAWGLHLRFPPAMALLALNQVVVVALPEELFFRGYLLGRFEDRWPPHRRLAGAPVGWALLLSAALFAVGHLLVDFNPQRLAVFFPALVFGWMRARTGSIVPGALYHALCNLLSEVLHTTYF